MAFFLGVNLQPELHWGVFRNIFSYTSYFNSFCNRLTVYHLLILIFRYARRLLQLSLAIRVVIVLRIHYLRIIRESRSESVIKRDLLNLLSGIAVRIQTRICLS